MMLNDADLISFSMISSIESFMCFDSLGTAHAHYLLLIETGEVRLLSGLIMKRLLQLKRL